MRPPDIVFILIDDLGWKDLGCQGSAFYETPHLDRLAARGMRFTDAYASCPVCSPTRASALTGKYPATLGITDWIDWFGTMHPARGRLIDVPYLKQLPTSETTVATTLREGGYATWHVGKWHLGGPGHCPQDHGFEINIGGCEVGSPGRGGYFSPWSIPALEDADVPEGTDLTDYLTDQAVDLIRRRDDRPFFLNLWHYTVHTPLQAKPEKIRKYETKAKALGLDQIEAIQVGEHFPTEHKRDRHVERRIIQSHPTYAAMIETLDENIGRLLAAIEAGGNAANTLIVFTSDNGGLATAEGSPTCNAPLSEGKGWMYEGGVREPLFAVWPAHIAAGSSCSVPVTTPDLVPTFLDAAQVPPPASAHFDGVSLLPLLRGASSLDREALYWHYPHYGNQGGTPGSSIRMGPYKLIEFFEDHRVELYNLETDLSEDHNLALELPDLATRLRSLLHAWRDRIEAKIPAPNPDWRETPPV